MGTFNLSAPPKYITMKMGTLVPIQCREVLPGDTWLAHSRALIRLAPMVAPVMSTVKCKIHHWFVPSRLCWTNWEKFITGGEDGMNASVYPTISITESVGEGTFLNHMGIPQSMANPTTISALPVRARNLIYNRFYRDQDFVTPLAVSLADGNDTTTYTGDVQVAWDKDIFTTARDSAYKGPDVVVPVSGGPAGIDSTGGAIKVAKASDGSSLGELAVAAVGAGSPSVYTTATSAGAVELEFDDPVPLTADTDDLFITPDDLRLTLALRRYEENRSRFGGRYREYLSALGVSYSDARLQDPEYLGGGQQVVQMSEVIQTSPDATDGTTEGPGVGNFRGHGIGSMQSNSFKRFFEEHGYVISFMIVKPVSQYSTAGLNKMWSRRTKEDHWQPELEHIGQEAIINRELYAASAMDYDPAGIFGYQDRYEHYRTGAHEPSTAGEMDSSLAFWHMARMPDPDTPTPYVLNQDFIDCVPTTRIYQATFEDQLWCRIDNSIIASRRVTAHATPRTF